VEGLGKTQQVCHRRCRNDDTFCDFYFATPELIFCEYRCFRKLVKHVVSLPTSTLLHNNHQCQQNMLFHHPHPPSLTTTTATPTPMPYLRNCDHTIGRMYCHQARLPSLSLQVWMVSRMAAMATSEPSKPQDPALPLPKTVIHRGSWFHPQHVYAGEIQVGMWFAHL